MKKFGVMAVAALLYVGVSLAFAADGGALVEKVCTQCHGLDAVHEDFGEDKAAWTAIVDRMLGKSKAPAVSAEERAAIIDWLAAQKK